MFFTKLINEKNGFQYLNKYQHSQQTFSYINKNNHQPEKFTNESDLKLIKAFTNTDTKESSFTNFDCHKKEKISKKLIPKEAKDIVIKNLRQTKQSVLQGKPIRNTFKMYSGLGIYSGKKFNG